MWYILPMEQVGQPRGRPRTGVTPKRNIRVGDVWNEAAALAEGRGETTTTLVIRALEREVRRLRRESGRTAP